MDIFQLVVAAGLFLRRDAVIAKVKQVAKGLGEMNRQLGGDAAWSAKINDEIARRLK